MHVTASASPQILLQRKGLLSKANLASKEVSKEAGLLSPGQHQRTQGGDVGLQRAPRYVHQFLGQVHPHLHSACLSVFKDYFMRPPLFV